MNVAYSWSGVLQPINADGSSVFKAGSTIKVAFQLIGTSAGIVNAVAKFSYIKPNAEVVGPVGQFRYDPKGKQYFFNWNTKGLSAGNYQLQIDLGDGVLRTVNVGLNAKR